jgi:hypothetical protein
LFAGELSEACDELHNVRRGHYDDGDIDICGPTPKTYLHPHEFIEEFVQVKNFFDFLNSLYF